MSNRGKHPPLRALRGIAQDPEIRRATMAAAGLGAAAAGVVKVALDRRSEDALRALKRDFALHQAEPMSQGLTRVALGQVDDALERLQVQPGEELPERAVHEARKSLKRLRALARLLRGELGEDAFAHENLALRDSGRHLAGARDAEVLVATLDDLLGGTDGSARGAYSRLRNQLIREQALAADRLREDPRAVGAVIEELARLRIRTAAWVPPSADFGAVAPGLRRVYRDGRRRYRRARAQPSVERLHDWRKRVKDLRHAAEVLAPADPQRMAAIAARANRLGETLGDDHDLAMLAEYVRGHRELTNDQEQARLLSLVSHRRGRLQRRARKLGAELYARKTERFVRRVARDWSRQAGGV